MGVFIGLFLVKGTVLEGWVALWLRSQCSGEFLIVITKSRKVYLVDAQGLAVNINASGHKG